MSKQNTKKKTELEKVTFTNSTPLGEKKDVQSIEMPAQYHPEFVEMAWYEYWHKKGYFTADANDTTKETFTIALPPPNVTGSLHIGHALTVAVQDAICRYHRMNGKNVLYIPGVDHAGIATQVVVEKQLAKQDPPVSRHEIGREKFVEKVFEWKEEYGQKIMNQLKRIGASLDWTRECFTMDETLSVAVKEAFIKMYEQGIIYRKNRLVNWSCVLKSAISNIEVDSDEVEGNKLFIPGHPENKKYEFGKMWSFAYKFEDQEFANDEIIISTTRPETMLGDVAVAVHPDDPRYKKFHGKTLIHPFLERKLVVITDKELVDMNFGTGAVKITPAHDPNDFECGLRHNLEMICVFTDDGKINENGGEFKGMMRFDARYAVIEELKKKGLYRDEKVHKLALKKCSRSKDVIEPMLKPQWYVKMDDLARQACEAVQNGTLKIVPEREKTTWFHFLGAENVQDWCISRQLWWGHRIPAYLVKIAGKEHLSADDEKWWIVAHDEQEARAKAMEKFKDLVTSESDIILQQDEDVLDTWFSSGLFPFSPLGWPNTESADFKRFFPTQMLETGLDILFFWVSKMVMMSLSLTGELPFTEVLLHAMVRDKENRKMSKSLGNVIDPIDVIEGITLQEMNDKLKQGNLSSREIEKAALGQKKQFPEGIPECGTDALRFTLLNYTAQGRDIALDILRVFGYRTFCNKMWQTTKFALMNWTDFKSEGIENYPTDLSNLTFNDKWILSRLNKTIKACNASFEKGNYDFMTYTQSCYDFWLKDLCDQYLEMIKNDIKSEDLNRRRTTQLVLYTCIEQCLRLLHPTMPFITEELWQRLPGHSAFPSNRESIMICPYPAPVAAWENDNVETEMKFVMEVVHAIRSLKGAYKLTPKQTPEVYIITSSQNDLLKSVKAYIEMLALSGNLYFDVEVKDIPAGCGVEVVNQYCEIHMMLKGLIDIDQEVKKQEKNKEKLVKVRDSLIERTQTEKYKTNTPEEVKNNDQIKLEGYNLELAKIDETIERLKKM
ncbi:Valyl-tRNA synthetase [Naegleria gruberi]|uniref:Valine--tRNA ligase, mitochondrial n=1 Tax=Naegleria gruberi TaxID=5762 RepID=D2VNA0_NAEGR|nr:Valyl-tRNA synthetase [Naegleria gruberi]EFC41616.1 Valyl-tRNA synthetase [Naegleria gruberi]|eukprot:XP_002674360.1 Valyl-tRNA synthetase [Naegleria gruberi strain NEG-M]